MIQKKLCIPVLCGVVSLLMIGPFTGSAQTAADHGTLERLTTLRDNFVAKIKTVGFSPSLPPPVILFDNPQTMGNYNDTTNSLHTTSDWASASGEMKGFFDGAAAHLDSTIPVPDNVSKEQYFNDNFESLAGDSRYTWFQAQMIIRAYHEQPVSGFAATVKASGN